ncbi:MAG: retroviral-like aspartic protease family protein [Deltaproteobacteria bacterium]|nr:retroviral-like aspartic protease family protein [Deltaproteobacteria bacterium]
MIRSGDDGSSRRRSKGPGLGSWGLLLSSLLPVGFALAALLGVGLARNLPSQGALLAALLVVALPILGLASPIRRGPAPAALGVAGWIWGTALLLCVPLYFPGELGTSVEDGLTWIAAPAGDDMAVAVADAGAALVTLVVPSDPPPPEASEMALEDDAPREPRSVPIAEAVPLDEAAEAEPEGPTGRVVLPYEGGGRSMRVPVTFLGPSDQVTHTMLFDTGATLTTLSVEGLAELGLNVPSDAPVVTLQTANGQVDAPLVLMDGVSLGVEEIPWATVAVCDACAEGGVAGLLGLNVTGLFQIALDHEEREIDMTSRGTVIDRYSDVVHWIELDSTAKVWTDGRIEVDVTAQNLARADIEALSIEVACSSRSFAVSLDTVPGNASRTTQVSLPRGTDCREYRVMLREGRWAVPR